jgi:Uma2 family endonuclease
MIGALGMSVPGCHRTNKHDLHGRCGRAGGERRGWMSSDAVFAIPPGPYTPADLAATPDDGQRYELVDGALLVSWFRTPLHQFAAGRLCGLLNAAGAAGLLAVCAIDVRCGPDTVVTPDVVMLLSSVVDEPDCVVVADHVALVAEIASPSTVRMDRVLRPRLYADAGIPAYLLFELEGPTVTWFALSTSGSYERRGVAAGDEELRVTEPFEVRIVPAELVRLRG